MVSKLPYELKLQIFEKITDVNDLLSVSKVNKDFRQICLENKYKLLKNHPNTISFLTDCMCCSGLRQFRTVNSAVDHLIAETIERIEELSLNDYFNISVCTDYAPGYVRVKFSAVGTDSEIEDSWMMIAGMSLKDNQETAELIDEITEGFDFDGTLTPEDLEYQELYQELLSTHSENSETRSEHSSI